MNRKFFTLMAAALLMGAPMSQTFAADEDPTYALFSDDVETHELANGIKFMLATSGESVGDPIGVKSVKIGSKTYYTYDESADEVAVFEVCNFSSNAVAATFQLKVNGKLFAMKEDSEAAEALDGDSDGADAVVTTFTVAANADGEYLLEDIAEIKLVGGSKPTIKVGETALVPVTENKPYDATELLSFNSKGVTLNFGTADVEGNIFSALYPVTVAENIEGSFVAGTYLVKGTESNIKAFKNAVAPESGSADANAAKAAAKKLSFAAVTTEDWELNTSAAAEGYKLEMVSGSVFYAEEDNLLFGNAAFTINEYDKLNCQGKLEMSATVTVGDDEDVKVMVAAVKTSKTDTKTYVTTVNATEDEGSQFKYITLPQLGSNTYFAASEFLKKDAISAYNILFTSGTAQGAGKEPEEKGRYLSAVVNSEGTAYELHATTPDSTIVNGPAAQWIATGFNGKYTLTLANRETKKELVLDLSATKNAKEYAITGDATYDENTAEIANVKAVDDDESGRSFNGKTIKLIPATLTQNDGYAVLTDEEQEGTFTLSFTGTSTLVGSRTYYLAPNATTPIKFVAKLDGDASLSIKRVDDSEGNLIELEGCAYLNADGDVLTDAVDSLYVPLYNLTYGDYKVYEDESTVLALSDEDDAEYSDYFFKKHLSGNYAMAAFDSEDEADQVAAADANAISINTEDEPLVFKNEDVLLNNLAKGDFAYVALEADDANDYATLEAVSRHATLENSLGAVSMQENKNGILEGILSVEPLTFWLDTADSEKTTPAFYISVGTGNNEDEVVTKAYNDEVRLFLFNPKDSATVYNEGSATISTDKKYILEGANLKAIFRPAALVAEDTLETVVDGELVTVVTKDADATKDQVNGLTSFQFGIALADEDVEGEYVVKSKSQKTYLYSLNGKLGFTATKSSAMVFTLGEGDATANEAIAAEAGVQVIGGQGAVTVQGAAGKVITVANILGQTIANQVAASDNVTIAAPAGIVVVAVEGEATKVVVK